MIKTPTKILGIGQIGCSVIDSFQKIGGYKTFRVSTKLNNFQPKNDALLEETKLPEHYENINLSKLKWLKTFSKKDEVFIVLSGFDLETSSTLAILEKIKPSSITILYLIPDVKILNQKLFQHHRIVSNVLQEYTRSGIFSRIFFVSYKNIDLMVGGIPIIEYNQIIASHISSTFNMLFYLSEIEPLMYSNDELPVGSRISTIGVCDVAKSQMEDFCILKDITDISYAFTISNKDLQEKKDMFKDLKSIMDSSRIEKQRVSYSIFGSEYNKNIGYYVKSTSITQEITG